MMRLHAKLHDFLGRFIKDERASVAVEMTLMAPLLAWAFVAVLEFFDAYRAESVSHKAGITIADMISREADTITGDYIDGAHDLLKFLMQKEDPDPDLRITVFYWDEDDGQYYRVWSKERGPRQPLKTSDINAMTHRIPLLADGERAILVETWTNYQPPFNPYGMGLKPINMETFNVISPRFTTQLCFSNTPNDSNSLQC